MCWACPVCTKIIRCGDNRLPEKVLGTWAVEWTMRRHAYALLFPLNPGPLAMIVIVRAVTLLQFRKLGKLAPRLGPLAIPYILLILAAEVWIGRFLYQHVLFLSELLLSRYWLVITPPALLLLLCFELRACHRRGQVRG